mmetsp:Transcript_105541/g.295665  ORF Transcript_105541/g.295665 Transcript_105541/m.295665 type:complete len:275 (-) Transcript_105541:160-984(-)
MEVIQSFGARVDLNTSKNGSSFLEASLACVDDVFHQEVLRVIKGIRKLQHPVLSIRQTLPMWEDQFLNSTLLKVSERLNLGGDCCASLGDTLKVIGSRNGTSTAGIDERDSLTLDLADSSVRGNTDVRAIDDEAVSTVRDVSRHGAKASVSAKGKAGQATKAEVVTINLDEIVFQTTSKLIATERGAQQRVGAAEAPISQGADNLHLELSVGERTGKVRFHNLVELGVLVWVAFLCEDELDLFQHGLLVGNHVQGVTARNSRTGRSEGIGGLKG